MAAGSSRQQDRVANSKARVQHMLLLLQTYAWWQQTGNTLAALFSEGLLLAQHLYLAAHTLGLMHSL